ncbi:hypothetical protein [Deinococcus koreensis]|uniref:hypothetical protein n=1 Tax=Deinococcus koreensis TaxID=2054903 RepID=UPI0013FD7C20|nr:hypothetical protein [Deinococcus koreensis]
MTAFLQTALSFPTVLWSVLFAFCVVAWGLVAGGLLSSGEDGWAGGDGDAATSAGVLGRLGLGGVPALLVLTLLSFIGWVLTYLLQLLLWPGLPAALRLPVGLLTLLGALVAATLLTSWLLRPLRRLLQKVEPGQPRSLVGRVGQVLSARVDERSGRAAVEDGGAGLILQVRAQPPDQPRRGERVVLLDYDPAENSYLVVSEDRFNA